MCHLSLTPRTYWEVISDRQRTGPRESHPSEDLSELPPLRDPATRWFPNVMDYSDLKQGCGWTGVPLCPFPVMAAPGAARFLQAAVTRSYRTGLYARPIILLGFIDPHIDFLCSIPHRYHILSAGLQGRAPFVSADTGELGAAGLHKSHARYPYGLKSGVYAIITGPENKQKIIYVTSDNHTENYNDPEEKVRAEFWAELIYEYDYPAHRIKVEVTIPDRVPTDRADIVIFSDDECKKPYAVVECKRDGVTDAEFLQAIEQGVGNATWVKLRASYVVIIAGATRRVLDFSDDSTGILERENNIIADLPKAYGKPQAFRFYRGGEYTDVDGKKKKAPDIQPVAREDLITAIKKCHNTLWGGGRLSPPTAFGELCKLIFVKISDEQKPRKKGEPYQFQIKTHEPSSKLAERINALYNEQKVKDPEVFTDSIKVDDRVLRTVVSHLESINLNKTDLDVKGVAFEQFMDGFFKGDFGQYFTPRPIIEFAVKMMKPEHDWDVLDPACGSGGFLLHALDYMRSQASEYYDKDTVDYFNYWHDFASKHLYGIEINDEIARVAKMNMIVHDDGHTNVISFDALDSIDKMHDHNRGFEAGKFDLILTNPPFGSTITKAEKPYLANYELGKTKDAKGKYKDRPRQSSEILFIERIWEFLKPGTGKAAIVLPDGVLTNSSAQYVRDFILEKFQLLAVVSLPQCAFAHFGAGVKTSIIFVRKRKADEKPDENEAIFMAAPALIGYDATGRKTDSQLDEIIQKYEEFQKDATPFFA